MTGLPGWYGNLLCLYKGTLQPTLLRPFAKFTPVISVMNQAFVLFTDIVVMIVYRCQCRYKSAELKKQDLEQF